MLVMLAPPPLAKHTLYVLLTRSTTLLESLARVAICAPMLCISDATSCKWALIRAVSSSTAGSSVRCTDRALLMLLQIWAECHIVPTCPLVGQWMGSPGVECNVSF